MNKQFMIVNGKIIVLTEKGMNEPIPYVDNIEDILLFENEISYLRKVLAEDEEFLKSKIEDKGTRKKSAIKNTTIVTGAAMLATGAVYLSSVLVPELLNEQTYNDLMVIIGGVGVTFGPFLGWMEYRFGPSKNIFPCYEERIKYEKEMIEILESELEYLKSHLTAENIGNYEEMVPYDVRDEGSLKYLKDSIRLRDIYGYNKKTIMSLYSTGELTDELVKLKFDENVIMDFITYLDRVSLDASVESKDKSIKK